MKPLTRAEMKRAAQALHEMSNFKSCDEKIIKKYGVDKRQVQCFTSPRCAVIVDLLCHEEASMLMSEAHRPAGSCNHEGDD